MRPDEHKKKKSAAYKKKHGIGNKVPSATDNATVPDDKKAKKEHRLKHQQNEPHHHDHASNSNFKNVQNVTKTHASNESSGSETEVVEKKSFRRREVVSNWRKYDLEPENEEGTVTSKGENFEKLLTMAGEAMSRFRFKDELEWEEDIIKVGDGDRTDENLGGSGVFGVDLAEISSSMSCIPIHRLLGIDQSLFPTDQLESHLQSVTRNRNMYNNTIIRQKEEQSKYRTCEMSKDSHIVSSSDLEHTSSSSHSQSVHRISEVIEKHKDNEKGVRQVSETLQADNTKECPANEIVTDRTANGDSVNGKQKSQIEPSISLQDGDLDQLLDMEKMGQEKDIDAGKEDNNIKSGNDNVRKISNEKKNAANKEADELEDWLDSILD